MRATVAKRLRREANNETIGMPKCAYAETGYLQRVLKKISHDHKYFVIDVIRMVACTRLHYKKLKQAFKGRPQ